MSENTKNVSVDDMMRNLKRKSKEVREEEKDQGQLVVRADGSSAIKVRTRKRRSEQAKSEVNEKSQKKKIIVLSSLVILLLLVGIGYAFVAGYFNSGGFEKKVITSLENSSGADVEVKSLSVGLSQAELKSFSLSWNDDSALIKKINAQKIIADTGALGLLTGGWSGSEVNISNTDVQLGYTKAGAKTKASEQEFDYNVFLSNKTKFTIGESGEWVLSDTSASYKENEFGENQVELYGGEFVSPLDLNYDLSTGIIVLKDDHMDVSVKLASKEDDGSVLLDGKVVYTEGDEMNLATTFKEVAMKDWLNLKMQRFIGGQITDADGKMKMNLGDPDSLELSINAKSRLMTISSFPFVRNMSLELKNDYFVEPKFEDGSSFKLLQNKDVTQITDINLVQNSQFRVIGNLNLAADDTLTGKFRIGIPVMNLKSVDKKVITAVFNDDDGLFFWATVNISGTASNPEDDLKEQIDNARNATILKGGTDAERFDMLTE